MKSIFKVIFWLNLDTAAGTAITSLFVAKYLDVEFQWTSVLALAVTILVIYNFDHIIDVMRVESNKLSNRYRFYKDNLKGIIIYEFILILILLSLAFFMPGDIIVRGAVLGFFTILYFLFLFLILPKRFVFKEIIIALVFTLGVFLVPMTALEDTIINQRTLLLGLQIFLLALVNTFIFAWYEYESDQQYGHSSLAITLGKKTVQILSVISLIIFLISLFISFTLGVFWVYIVTLEIMGAILFLSLIYRKYLVKNGLYRIVVESIFLIPLFSLLV